MNFYEKIFIYLTYSWYVFFILAYFNLWEPAIDYYELINFYYILFLAMVLIIRFNPFFYYKFTESTRTMVFSAGVALLLSLGYSKIIINLYKTKTKIKNIIK